MPNFEEKGERNVATGLYCMGVLKGIIAEGDCWGYCRGGIAGVIAEVIAEGVLLGLYRYDMKGRQHGKSEQCERKYDGRH